MTDAAAELDQIDRIHDDEPEQAARRLRQLNWTALAADRLGTLAFLYNHVLGEKFGLWREAVERLARVAARDDASPRVLRQWAAGATLAGDRDAQAQAQRRLADQAHVAPEVAACLAAVAAFEFAADPVARAAEIDALARRAIQFDASSLDAGFAAAFNNVTTSLLEKTGEQPLAEAVRAALVNGADAARHFWLRAGEWLQDERSDYLRARVLLRVGDVDGALAAAERALEVVAANGGDPIERAFLLQPLAAALARRGEVVRANSLRAEANGLADAFDPSYRPYFMSDSKELFGEAGT